MEETLAKILALLEQLVSEEESEAVEAAPEEEVAPMGDDVEEMAEADAEEMAEDEEQVAMSEKVARLERQLKRAEMLQRVRDELPSVDAQTASDLAEVRMSDEGRYKRLVAMIPGRETSTIGSAQAAPVSMSDSRIANFAEEAASAGVPRGVRFIKFLQAKGLSSSDIETALNDATIKTRIANAYASRGTK